MCSEVTMSPYNSKLEGDGVTSVFSHSRGYWDSETHELILCYCRDILWWLAYSI